MSGVDISVSVLTEVSKPKYLFHAAIASCVNFLVGIKVNLGNSLTPARGWKIPVRDFIRNFGGDLGRTPKTTYVRIYSGRLFTVKYLDDDQGREALKSQNVESTFDIKPISKLAGGRYLEVFWYYDGGSDGQQEAKSHNLAVETFLLHEKKANG